MLHMDDLTPGHWIAFLVIVLLPIVVGVLSRSFVRALLWSVVVGLAMMGLMMWVERRTASPRDMSWELRAYTALIFVSAYLVTTAIAYGIKRSLRR